MGSPQDERVIRMLDSFDFGAEWRKLHEKRGRADSAKRWDKAAPRFGRESGTSSYVHRFVELVDARPGETVIDVGAGTGAVTLPLATAGHPVTAIDFSPGMLEVLGERASDAGVEGIRTVQAAWEDDWSALGIEPADIAVASRSIIVADLEQALIRIDEFAKRRACITIPYDGSPRHDARIFDALGREQPRRYDVLYALGILLSRGHRPEVRLIRGEKRDSYQSPEEARESIIEALKGLRPGEEGKLDRWLEENLHELENEAGGVYWTRKINRRTEWAFVSWEH